MFHRLVQAAQCGRERRGLCVEGSDAVLQPRSLHRGLDSCAAHRRPDLVGPPGGEIRRVHPRPPLPAPSLRRLRFGVVADQFERCRAWAGHSAQPGKSQVLLPHVVIGPPARGGVPPAVGQAPVRGECVHDAGQ